MKLNPANKKPAVFKLDDGAYHADTCQSLVAAVAAGEVSLHALARGSYPGDRFQELELPGVCSIGMWDANGEQSWGLDEHRNEGIEFTYLETGSTSFSVNNDSFQLQAGDLFITRPWQAHRVGNPNIGAGKLYWIILDVGVRRPNQDWQWPDWLMLSPADLNDLTAMLRQNEQAVWHGVGNEIAGCFRNISKRLMMHQTQNQISGLTVYVNEIFLLLLEMFRQREAHLNPSLSSSRRTVGLFFEKLKQRIEVLGQPWSVEEMADECGLGVTSFTHHCKQATNRTPSRYLNDIRVEVAAELLRDSPEWNITEIALQCGFSSSQYFATVFKQQKGMSPRLYREKKG